MEPWVFLYLEAARETDADKVPPRVAAARQAMETRLQDLEQESYERRRIEDALYGMFVLETEARKWPRAGKKKDPIDGYPLELPNTISLFEKESREAEAKLAAMRKAKKHNPRLIPGH
jgi:hypothetical protein